MKPVDKQRVIDLRKQGYTQREIGEMLNITATRVSQIETAAMADLGLPKRSLSQQRAPRGDRRPQDVCQLLRKHKGHEDEPPAVLYSCRIRHNGCGNDAQNALDPKHNRFPRRYCSSCGWNREVAQQRIDNGFIIDPETGLRRLQS